MVYAGEISCRWASTVWILVLLLSSATLDHTSLAAAAPAGDSNRPIDSDDANALAWGPVPLLPGLPPRYPPPIGSPQQWYPEPNYPPVYPPPVYPPSVYPDLPQYDVCAICNYYPNYYQQLYPTDVCYRCRPFRR